MKQIFRMFDTLKKLDKEYNDLVAKNWKVKETHVSQSPLDQPHVIMLSPDAEVEIHMMVGNPLIRTKKRYICHYNKEFEEKQKKKKIRRKRK